MVYNEELVEIIRIKYLNIPVKIVKANNFFLKGIITGVSGNFILFKTNKESIIESLINLDEVKEVVPRPPKPGEEVKNGGGQ